jgi:hypothetical protein
MVVFSMGIIGQKIGFADEDEGLSHSHPHPHPQDSAQIYTVIGSKQQQIT